MFWWCWVLCYSPCQRSRWTWRLCHRCRACRTAGNTSSQGSPSSRAAWTLDKNIGYHFLRQEEVSKYSQLTFSSPASPPWFSCSDPQWQRCPGSCWTFMQRCFYFQKLHNIQMLCLTLNSAKPPPDLWSLRIQRALDDIQTPQVQCTWVNAECLNLLCISGWLLKNGKLLTFYLQWWSPPLCGSSCSGGSSPSPGETSQVSSSRSSPALLLWTEWQFQFLTFLFHE